MRRYVVAGVALLLAASADPSLAQKSGPSPAGPLHPRMFPHRDPHVAPVYSGRQVGVRSGLPNGAINAGIYKDGKLLATKSAGPGYGKSRQNDTSVRAVHASPAPVRSCAGGIYRDGRLLISKRGC